MRAVSGTERRGLAVRSTSLPPWYPGAEKRKRNDFASPLPSSRLDTYGFLRIHQLDYAHGNHSVQDGARREMVRVEAWATVFPTWFILVLAMTPGYVTFTRVFRGAVRTGPNDNRIRGFTV